MSYDKKFKERVLAHLSNGHTQESTAQLFGIGTATIKEWKKRIQTGEGLEARIRQRKPKKIILEKLQAYIADKRDTYISEIAGDYGCSCSAIRKALKKLGITRKKDNSLQRTQ